MRICEINFSAVIVMKVFFIDKVIENKVTLSSVKYFLENFEILFFLRFFLLMLWKLNLKISLTAAESFESRFLS